MADHNKFPMDARITGPRVTFSSFKWEGNRPKLTNTPQPPTGGNTSTTTLYLPSSFKENYSAKWNPEQLITAGVDMSAQGVKVSAAEAVSTIGANAGLGGIVNTGKYMTGVTAFPGEFLTFTMADPMNMSFIYDLVARNKPEAELIQKIVQTFKTKLLPTFTGIVLRFPDIWNIDFLNINGPGFPATVGSYKNLALVQCNVGYGGGAQSALSFSDGNPVIVTLELAFQSIKHSYIEG